MCALFVSVSVLVFVLVVPATVFAQNSATTWTASFEPSEITAEMQTTIQVNLTISIRDNNELVLNGGKFHVRSSDENLLHIDRQFGTEEVSDDGTWTDQLSIDCIFLGTTSVYVELVKADGTVERSDIELRVTILRPNRVIDTVFTGSVATLVSILYINFGAALDLQKLKGIAKRPIGPAIGFMGQFVIMPLLSFGLALLLFPNSVEMQLGMFITGASPAGGASNIWTILLGGNLDLSIAMTGISTIASFGMMPFWIFTLGRVIFENGNIPVPYESLSTYVIALVIPLAIGLLIQRFLPRVSRILVRILKPVSSLLILFIVVFAIVTNLYLFELFSWQIVVGGLCLPWLAYILGYAVACLCKQSRADCIAIAMETGIQNTGIAIFLLRFTLSQPTADLTTVMPVSVAIMTPVPLLCILVVLKIRQYSEYRKNKGKIVNEVEIAGVENKATTGDISDLLAIDKTQEEKKSVP